jgi:hypothetical protein
MGVEVIVPLALFGMIALIVYFVTSGNAKVRLEQQATLRALIAQGATLDPETIAALSRKTERPAETDLRSGIILGFLSVGVGLCGFLSQSGAFGEGAAQEAQQSEGGFYVVAIILGSIAAGQLLAWAVRRRKDA